MKANGYSICVRLTEFSTENGMGMCVACCFKIFGPAVWDNMSKMEQQYFKRLAYDYKQSDIGRADHLYGMRPSRDDFLNAVFGVNMNEWVILKTELEIYSAKITGMSNCETV